MPVCKRTKNRTDQHKLVQEKKKPPPAGDWSSLQFCSLHIKLNIAPRDWTWVCSAGVLQRRFCSRAEVMGANRTFIIILMPGGPVKWLNSHLEPQSRFCPTSKQWPATRGAFRMFGCGLWGKSKRGQGWDCQIREG